MSDFKVGDRVRVTGDTGNMYHGFDPGTLGTIDSPPYKGVYGVEGDNHEAWYVDAQDLEAVEPVRESCEKLREELYKARTELEESSEECAWWVAKYDEEHVKRMRREQSRDAWQTLALSLSADVTRTGEKAVYLTDDERSTLAFIVLHIGGDPNHSPRKHTDSVYDKLRKAGTVVPPNNSSRFRFRGDAKSLYFANREV